MNSPLFRKEAIQNNTQRLLGEVLLTRPLSFWIFIIAITLLVLTVGTLLVFGKFARRETVAGYLLPDKGLVKIYAPYNGVIDKKFISEGQQVLKNENLLEVTTERGSTDSVSVNQQLIIGLLEQKSNLKQRIADESDVLDSEYSRLNIKLSNQKNEYYQIQQQLRSNREQLVLSKTQLEKYQKLKGKGLVSEDVLVSKTKEYYNNKAALDGIKRLIINKQTEISTTQKQLEQSPLRKSTRIKELESRLTSIEERLIELKNSRSYTIKAPINGRVTSTQIAVGKNVSSRTPILTVIPENTVLYAELFLPSRAIGFVKKDQKVLLRYDAFPYQRYGLYEGKIIQITETVIHPNETQLPIANQEPVYQIKVALDKQFINAYGKQMQLQSGMSVAADIILEERSLGQWLLEPIYSLKGKL